MKQLLKRLILKLVIHKLISYQTTSSVSKVKSKNAKIREGFAETCQVTISFKNTPDIRNDFSYFLWIYFYLHLQTFASQDGLTLVVIATFQAPHAPHG